MKRCGMCLDYKPLSEFNRSSKASDGRQWKCRQCSAAHYQANRERHMGQIKAALRVRRGVAKQYLYGYLLQHPCVDCGESDPIVLDFDHARGEKVDSVVRMAHRTAPLAVIIAEIAKCDIRCADCHRRKTARDFGWYGWLDNASVVQQERTHVF